MPARDLARRRSLGQFASARSTRFSAKQHPAVNCAPPRNLGMRATALSKLDRQVREPVSQIVVSWRKVRSDPIAFMIKATPRSHLVGAVRGYCYLPRSADQQPSHRLRRQTPATKARASHPGESDDLGAGPTSGRRRLSKTFVPGPSMPRFAMRLPLIKTAWSRDQAARCLEHRS
jgi:hypothetical protein